MISKGINKTEAKEGSENSREKSVEITSPCKGAESETTLLGLDDLNLKHGKYVSLKSSFFHIIVLLKAVEPRI